MKRIIFLLVFMLGLTGHAWALPPCTGSSVGIDTPTDPYDQDHTIPSVTNGFTIVDFATRNGAREISSATIGGLALTQIGTFVQTTNTSHEIWYRKSVPSGTQTVHADWDGVPLSYVSSVITCGSVDQTTPFSDNQVNNGSGTAVSVTCTTTSGQLVIGFVAANGNSGAFTAAGHTIVSQANADATLVSGTTTKTASGSSTSMTATIASADWSSFCVALNESASFMFHRRLND